MQLDHTGDVFMVTKLHVSLLPFVAVRDKAAHTQLWITGQGGIVPWARGAGSLPGVDLQRGLQELSALLLGLGQLLHAQEVPGGPHLQHGDHGRVGV